MSSKIHHRIRRPKISRDTFLVWDISSPPSPKIWNPHLGSKVKNPFRALWSAPIESKWVTDPPLFLAGNSPILMGHPQKAPLGGSPYKNFEKFRFFPIFTSFLPFLGQKLFSLDFTSKIRQGHSYIWTRLEDSKASKMLAFSFWPQLKGEKHIWCNPIAFFHVYVYAKIIMEDKLQE